MQNGKWSNRVGATGKETLLNQFTDNWYDLATIPYHLQSRYKNSVVVQLKYFGQVNSWDGKRLHHSIHQ